MSSDQIASNRTTRGINAPIGNPHKPNERPRRPLGDATNQSAAVGKALKSKAVLKELSGKDPVIYEENPTIKVNSKRNLNQIYENNQILNNNNARLKRPNSTASGVVLQSRESGLDQNIKNENIDPASFEQVENECDIDVVEVEEYTEEQEKEDLLPQYKVRTNEVETDESCHLEDQDDMSVSNENDLKKGLDNTSSPVFNQNMLEELNLIDEESLGDPQAVAIYANDIFQYYRSIETNKVARYGYMSRQTEINEDMRKILVDWLIEVHMNFKVKPETIFLAINIMDRFLERTLVGKSKLQLVGCASLLIASKYEDIYAPEISELEYITKNAYTKEEFVKMEALICNKLKFDLTLPTPFHFIQRFLRAAIMFGDNGAPISESLVQELKTEAFFFLQLSLLEYKCLAHKPSGIAASAIYLAFQRYQMKWNDEIVSYTGYKEDDIHDCVCLIYKVYRKDRDQIKAGIGKPSSASRYYNKKKNVLVKLASQIL